MIEEINECALLLSSQFTFTLHVVLDRVPFTSANLMHISDTTKIHLQKFESLEVLHTFESF